MGIDPHSNCHCWATVAWFPHAAYQHGYSARQCSLWTWNSTWTMISNTRQKALRRPISSNSSSWAKQWQSFIFPFMFYYYAYTYSFVSCFVNSISDTETMMPGGDCPGRTQCFVFHSVLWNCWLTEGHLTCKTSCSNNGCLVWGQTNLESLQKKAT